MKLNEVRVVHRRKKQKFLLTPIGDVHIGAAGCDEGALRRDVERIAEDPFHYTILMGDFIDAIQPDDKRWDDQSIAPWLHQPEARARVADAEFERFLDIVSPIPPERILGVHEGNHEITVRSRHYLDVTLDLARKLGVPYLAQEAFTRFHFQYERGKQRSSFDIFSTHGSGGGRKPGAKVNKITDLGGFIDADIYLMGHVHERLAVKNVLLSMSHTGKLCSRERIFGLTGTYLKTYSENNSYGARALYPPTSIGPITLELDPATQSIRAIT